MSKIIKKSIITIIILIFAWFLFQGGCKVYWYIMAWSMGAPENYSKVVDTFRALPSEEVIIKLYTIDMSSPYPQMAIKVLAERKEKKAVPELIKLTKSRNKHISRDAIWALGLINDERAIEPLMDIIRNGKNNENYGWALLSLSKMKYEGVFPLIVEIAKSNYPANTEAITLLEEFGKPETIPLLVQIKNTIKGNSFADRLDKTSVDNAIKHIESLQK
jgi:HEAT repeat protein